MRYGQKVRGVKRVSRLMLAKKINMNRCKEMKEKRNRTLEIKRHAVKHICIEKI